jgi:predicted lipoprotein with Yx(FWY)xxD motif
MSKQMTRTYSAIAVALAVAGVVAAVALASGSRASTLRSVANRTLATQVVVNAQGRTLYALAPESARRLLCRSAACLRLWPPLTVASNRSTPKAGAGISGHVGLLRRGAHSFQLTLRGMPLYRFSGDRAGDEANGQGIHSFGGTWHAVTASATSAPSTTMPPAPTTPSPSGSSPAPYATGAPQAPSPPSTTTQAAPTTPTTTPTSTTPTYPSYPGY